MAGVGWSRVACGARHGVDPNPCIVGLHVVVFFGFLRTIKV